MPRHNNPCLGNSCTIANIINKVYKLIVFAENCNNSEELRQSIHRK